MKMIGFAVVMASVPSGAVDLLKLLDPEDKSGDQEKIKKILEGAKSIIGSAAEIDYESELMIGKSLAVEGFKRYGLPVKDNELQQYISLVGNSVARNAGRPNIPYFFVAVQSHLYNAFASPGGIIFITSALLQGMRDESQLAAVLAHEVAHVGHKHALKSIQRARFFDGVGKITVATAKKDKKKEYSEMMDSLQTVLFDKGLDQQMEYEADRSGMNISYRTGYDPSGMLSVLEMLKKKEDTSEKKGTWFSTHPPLSQRIGRCHTEMNRYPDARSLAIVPERFIKYAKRL
ncbi:MAG: peptidase M48 [Deltaproteobacteria bacterium RBG_13_49_15]|nr:MAG: peptidase M48 [Deltaproteobacteria bacterium RBG_13_49_15]